MYVYGRNVAKELLKNKKVIKKAYLMNGFKEDEILIKVELNMGDAEVSTWGCDLSYEYVKINGEYRS